MLSINQAVAKWYVYGPDICESPRHAQDPINSQPSLASRRFIPWWLVYNRRKGIIHIQVCPLDSQKWLAPLIMTTNAIRATPTLPESHLGGVRKEWGSKANSATNEIMRSLPRGPVVLNCTYSGCLRNTEQVVTPTLNRTAICSAKQFGRSGFCLCTYLPILF